MVYIGAGLLEQIAPSNKRYYTKLTFDVLQEFLFDLSYNILGTSERKFVAFTGEMGLAQIDELVKERVGSLQLVDSVFITGSGDSLTFGAQFKTIRFINGIEITFKHMPLYDNLTYNRQLHPVTLKPLESYRITILDIGRRDGESNIVKVVRKDREFVYWTVAGAVSPKQGYGKSGSDLRANAKDGYSCHLLGEVGIMVKDPRACGELICIAE